MKKKLLFTFACVMALMAGFVSCTNEDFEELAPVAEMQKSAMTRSASEEITMEEAKARMAELNEMYGANVFLNEDLPASKFDDAFFLRIENILRKDLGLEPISNYVLDDDEIDCVPVVCTNIEMESEDDYADEDWREWTEDVRFPVSDIHNPYNEAISVFKTHGYVISYKFKRGIISQCNFLSLSNSTRLNEDNLQDGYKKGDLEEYAKLFDIRYVNNSFNLDGSIHKLISGDDPTNYAFDYHFEMMIGLSKIRVIASHYCNVLAFQLLL